RAGEGSAAEPGRRGALGQLGLRDLRQRLRWLRLRYLCGRNRLARGDHALVVTAGRHQEAERADDADRTEAGYCAPDVARAVGVRRRLSLVVRQDHDRIALVGLVALPIA